jgi:hypothetical protein
MKTPGGTPAVLNRNYGKTIVMVMWRTSPAPGLPRSDKTWQRGEMVLV